MKCGENVVSKHRFYDVSDGAVDDILNPIEIKCGENVVSKHRFYNVSDGVVDDILNPIEIAGSVSEVYFIPSFTRGKSNELWIQLCCAWKGFESSWRYHLMRVHSQSSENTNSLDGLKAGFLIYLQSQLVSSLVFTVKPEKCQ